MRCAEHDLASGPDGTCVLCRRALARAADPPPPGPRRALLVGAVLATLLVAATVGAVEARRSRVVQPVAAATLPVSSAASRDDGPPADELSAKDPDDVAPDDDLDPPEEPHAAAASADDEERRRWLEAVAQPAAAPEGSAAKEEEEPAGPAARVAGSPTLARQRVGRRDWREIARGQHIIVYTAGWCAYCRRAKSWMNKNGIVYDERDVDNSFDDARAMKRLNPSGTLPTFDIGGSVLVGFSPAQFIALMRQRG